MMKFEKKDNGTKKALTECNELFSIFMKSVETAKKNMEAEKRDKQKNNSNEK